MNSIINYFMPSYDSSEKQRRNRAAFLIFSLLVICITTILILPYLIIIPNNKQFLVSATISFFLCLYTLWHLKKTQNLEFSIMLFALNGLGLFFYVIFISGGANSPFLIWLTVFPAISILLRSRQALVLNAISCTVFLIGLGVLSLINYEFPNIIVVEQTPVHQLMSIITLGFFFTLIVLQYDRTNQKYTEQLAQSNRELERFAYITSHDMKEPLRNIISFSQLFKRRSKGRLNQNEEEYLDIISNNARQLHGLIEDVLEFSRINRDINEDLGEVDLQEVVSEIVHNLKTTLIEKKGSVVCSDLPKIKATEIHMLQLFQNLIENGIKYNKSNQPEVRISMIKESKNYIFKIKDNGIGILPEYHERIFEMFKRLHTREEYQGTGIGLALCKKIAQRYNGDLIVEESSAQGTTFALFLPKDFSF